VEKGKKDALPGGRKKGVSRPIGEEGERQQRGGLLEKGKKKKLGRSPSWGGEGNSMKGEKSFVRWWLDAGGAIGRGEGKVSFLGREDHLLSRGKEKGIITFQLKERSKHFRGKKGEHHCRKKKKRILFFRGPRKGNLPDLRGEKRIPSIREGGIVPHQKNQEGGTRGGEKEETEISKGRERRGKETSLEGGGNVPGNKDIFISKRNPLQKGKDLQKKYAPGKSRSMGQRHEKGGKRKYSASVSGEPAGCPGEEEKGVR